MNKRNILRWSIWTILGIGSFMAGSTLGKVYARYEEKILDVLSGPEGK